MPDLLKKPVSDGIELNFYQIPMDFKKNAKEIEDAQINTLKEIRQIFQSRLV